MATRFVIVIDSNDPSTIEKVVDSIREGTLNKTSCAHISINIDMDPTSSMDELKEKG